MSTQVKPIDGWLFKALGLGAFISLWWLAALWMSSLVMTSPLLAFQSLLTLIIQPDFWQSLFMTLGRMSAGLALGSIVGVSLGIMAGLLPKLKFFLAPWRWALMSIPPVVIVLLVMLWLGMGSAMVVSITVVLLTPIVYLNTVNGMDSIDPKWHELASVYNFGLIKRLRAIYLPAIAAPLLTAITQVCSHGVRIVVLAEVMGTNEGVGYQLANASANFDSQQLYAWVSLCLILVALLELLVVYPMQSWATRWLK